MQVLVDLQGPVNMCVAAFMGLEVSVETGVKWRDQVGHSLCTPRLPIAMTSCKLQAGLAHGLPAER